MRPGLMSAVKDSKKLSVNIMLEYKPNYYRMFIFLIYSMLLFLYLSTDSSGLYLRITDSHSTTIHHCARCADGAD